MSCIFPQPDVVLVGVNLRASRVGTIHTQAEEDDLELVSRAQKGEVYAFRLLYERHEKRIFSVVLSMCGNFADAEEIVQEGFLKAYRNIAAFKGQSSFYTWIYRIVVNYAIDFSRKKQRRREQVISDNPQAEKTAEGIGGGMDLFADEKGMPVDFLERKELGSIIEKALSTLSPVHRAVIILREIDGLSYEEISEALRCSKGTVMSRLFHARQKLQGILKPIFSLYQERVKEGNSKL